ncbi:hypothetical protein Tco_1221929, partial [Tanacetum coccineum]
MLKSVNIKVGEFIGFVSINVEPKFCKVGTDNAKISRKRSKPDNHEHGNGIECAKAGECYQGQQKSTYGQQ